MNSPSVQPFPFGRRNWVVFAAALTTIAAGYVLLSVPPAEGFLSLTLAPVFLGVGYCVMVPAAILIRGQRATGQEGQPPASPPVS